MKNSILFIGVLFFSLMTTSSYAQETSTEKKGIKKNIEKVVIKKNQKMEILTPSKMEQVNPQISSPLEFEEIREKVSHEGYIDPITGEWVSRLPPINENDILIIHPANDTYVRYPFHIMGETKKNSRVKVIIMAQSKFPGYESEVKRTMYVESDNDGKWKIDRVLKPLMIDLAQSKVPFKITAERINAENGNTAAVTVFYSPKGGPKYHSQGNKN